MNWQTLIPFGIRSQSCFLILPSSESESNSGFKSQKGLWQTHVPNIFGIGFNVTFIRFLHFSLSIILHMIILQPMSSSESSSQKSMIIGFKTLLSMQFSLQYSFSILTICSSAFVYCIRLWTRIISMSQNRTPKTRLSMGQRKVYEK